VEQSHSTTHYGLHADLKKTVVEMLSDLLKVCFCKQRPHNGIAMEAKGVGDLGNPVQLEWFANFWQTS